MTKTKRWDALIERIPRDRPIIGAEVGVKQADTSYRLLAARPQLTLIMIDPWDCPEPGSSYAKEADINALKPQEAHWACYHKTLKRVAFAGKRTFIKRMLSHEAAREVTDGCLDFVFIDGDHSYEGVSTDIKLWLPKIKKGGFISGHDYAHPKLPGVKKAVDEVFKSVKLDVNRTWFVRVK